ncbi:hypothetical protein IAU60_001962 [Kwoniella sp. DSM 27419]
MRGTNAQQDSRFKDKEAASIKATKFPKHFNEKVDLRKVNLSVLRGWIAQKVTELIKFEDDVVVEYVFGMLEDRDKPIPDPRKMQVSLVGFMDKHGAAAFMDALWSLLLSAQSTVGGVPAEFIEAKKKELQAKQEQDRQVQDRNTGRPSAQDSFDRRDNGLPSRPGGPPGGRRDDYRPGPGGRDRGYGPRGGFERERDSGYGQRRGYMDRPRDRSRSRSPGPGYRRRSPSPRRRESPPRRRRSPSPVSRRRSPSPPRRRERSITPPLRARRSPDRRARNVTPPVARRRPASRSPSPVRRREASGPERGRPRSRSRTPTPSDPGQGRKSRSRSRNRSPTVTPPRRRRDSATPPRRSRKGDSRSRSRSPRRERDEVIKKGRGKFAEEKRSKWDD